MALFRAQRTTVLSEVKPNLDKAKRELGYLEPSLEKFIFIENLEKKLSKNLRIFFSCLIFFFVVDFDHN